MSNPGKTVIVTAGNRGGGVALSKRFIASGAHVVMIADKQSDIAANNSPCLSDQATLIQIDLSDVAQIEKAVKTIAEQFGSIDILINNFSIFNFKNVMNTTADEYQSVMRNVFATLFFSKACIPYLKNAINPHIINIAPPLDMQAAREACEQHLLFSIAKYGMSFCTLGMAEEFKSLGIAVNSLWQERPIFSKTLIDNFNNDVVKGSNRPELYAEAAYLISLKSANAFSGNYCIDEDIVRESGIDPIQFAVDPKALPVKDIFLPGVNYALLKAILEQ